MNTLTVEDLISVISFRFGMISVDLVFGRRCYQQIKLKNVKNTNEFGGESRPIWWPSVTAANSSMQCQTVKSNDFITRLYGGIHAPHAHQPPCTVSRVSAADAKTAYVHENSRRRCVFIRELCRVRIKEKSDEKMSEKEKESMG